MAENKTGPNIGAGAGILAKRVQKSLNRAQEKVMQKLGKNMETKDEQFEQCSQHLLKQQTDGGRLSKDVKAYFNAVKAMHETSKRLSQTLRDVYEPEWQGGEDLSVIMESEDLLWNDYEEKLTDQIVRTMENYTGQFLEVKERMAKRGRKLVDYDSSRHHLEGLQNAKKKDEAKITKAEEEFNKAQSVFEEINKELREELPVLHQSRIGCYVTVFQNISNLRDVFYKEMSVLNHELYNVMKKLETQHSGKPFIIKGLNTNKSKKRKSLVISAPIPCNTAFPADHTSLHTSGQNGKEADTPSLGENPTIIISEEPTPAGEVTDVPAVASAETSDSDELSSNDPNTPKRQSVCDSVNSDRSDVTADGLNPFDEPGSSQSEDSSSSSAVEVQTERSEAIGGDEASDRETPTGSTDGHVPHAEQEESAPVPTKPPPPPVPAPRLSFSPVESTVAAKEGEGALVESTVAEKEGEGASRLSFSPAESRVVVKEGEGASPDLQSSQTTTGNASASQNPSGFLYKAVALESQASEDGLLQFEKGDVILVLSETVDQQEGMLNGVREESWNQYRDLTDRSGYFMENLIQPLEN